MTFGPYKIRSSLTWIVKRGILTLSLGLRNTPSSLNIEMPEDTELENDSGSRTGGELVLLRDLKAKAQSRLEIVPYLPIDQLVASHTLSDDDVLAYYDHVRTDGELAALRWVRDKLGPNLPIQPQPSASERK